MEKLNPTYKNSAAKGTVERALKFRIPLGEPVEYIFKGIGQKPVIAPTMDAKKAVDLMCKVADLSGYLFRPYDRDPTWDTADDKEEELKQAVLKQAAITLITYQTKELMLEGVEYMEEIIQMIGDARTIVMREYLWLFKNTCLIMFHHNFLHGRKWCSMISMLKFNLMNVISGAGPVNINTVKFALRLVNRVRCEGDTVDWVRKAVLWGESLIKKHADRMD